VLVGSDLTVQFPECPGEPVFRVAESDSDKNCPTDLQTVITPTDYALATCEDPVQFEAALSGTNKGAACTMTLVVEWSVEPGTGNASVEGGKTSNPVQVKGKEPGTATLVATSRVGARFAKRTGLNISSCLTVAKDGKGSGTVTGKGISCGAD
jgi:hypothetical protein